MPYDSQLLEHKAQVRLLRGASDIRERTLQRDGEINQAYMISVLHSVNAEFISIMYRVEYSCILLCNQPHAN